LIIRVETDAGITGIGEVDSAPMAVKGAIDGPFSHTTAVGLGQVVLGADPFETEKIWHKMYRANIYGGRRGVGIHAMSGIDMALWDIKGKALGLPVWKLLGGGFHQRIRCYASSLFGPTPEKTGELARRFRGQGFTAVKFGWDPMGQDEKTDVALVREGRKGLGDDADLLIDAGLVWDSKTALQRARAFSDYRIFWLEEPLRPDDYDGYRKLAEATHVRIAAGEEESERKSYLDLMDRGRVDVVQVDLTRCGGFTEAMKIAALAWDRGLPVANHGFTTYINVAAALHWLNSIPNALICEFVAEEETNLREAITRQKLRARDGYLDIPQEPGLGIDLDEEAIRKYRVA
jgi:L-alanine-DL-glutamate epimerase-like enolase superfamily enzyme